MSESRGRPIPIKDVPPEKLKAWAEQGNPLAVRERQRRARTRKTPRPPSPPSREKTHLIPEARLAGGLRREEDCLIYQEASSKHSDDLQDKVGVSKWPSGAIRLRWADGVSIGDFISGFTGSQSAQEAIEGIKASKDSPGHLSNTVYAFEDSINAITNRGTGTTLGVADIIGSTMFLVHQGTEMVFVVRENGAVELVSDPVKTMGVKYVNGKARIVTAAIKAPHYAKREFQTRKAVPLGPKDWVAVLTDFNYATFIDPRASPPQVKINRVDIRATQRALSGLARGVSPEKVTTQLVGLRKVYESGYFDDTTILLVPPSARQ